MHDHHEKRIGWVVLLNLVITVSEYIGGVLSGSLALISDAGHNLSDVLSLILGYAGERFSHKEPDKDYSFGYKRLEIFTALINALALWAVGAYVIFEAVKRINSPEHIALGLMLGIAVIGLAGNLLSVLVLNKDKGKDLNMKAAYMHLFFDTISSAVVILSAVIIYFTGFAILDIIASVFIAAMVFWSGLGIVRNTLHIFMQGVPDGIEIDDVQKNISAIEGVCSIHDMHIWSVDSNEVFFSCHISIDNKIKSDDAITSINKILQDKYNITHTAIQIECGGFCKINQLLH